MMIFSFVVRTIQKEKATYMKDLSNYTLAQIVKDDYRAASVFEKYHLDYCCKGRRTVEQACADDDIEKTDLLNELAAVMLNAIMARPDYFDHLPLQKLADHIIKTHHSFVRKDMPLIHGYLKKLYTKYGAQHMALAKILEIFSNLQLELDKHIKKEENILFPFIGKLEQEGDGIVNSPQRINLQLPVAIMEDEHADAVNALAQIRELTNNYTVPANACTTYRLAYTALQAFEHDLHQHIHLENNILFPKALERISVYR